MAQPVTESATTALTPRRSWLKRLGAVFGAGLLARSATAAPQALGPLGIQDSSPYVGDIILVAFNYSPPGWVECDGRLLSIAEYDTLFQLIGTTYGGNGETNFAVPDLRGRIPVGQGNGYIISETGGVEQVTLTAQQMPRHTHRPADSATTNDPTGGYLAQATGRDGAGTPFTPRLYTSTVTETNRFTELAGGSQPHDNMPPVLGMRYLISLYGVFPSAT